MLRGMTLSGRCVSSIFTNDSTASCRASAADIKGILMWRSFFLAVGAYCCLLGVEALALEKAVVKTTPSQPRSATRDVIPPDWAPWSLLGTGAVVLLYSFTLPQRVGG